MLKVVVLLIFPCLLQSVISLNLGNDLEELKDDGLNSSNFGLRHFKNRHGATNRESSYERNSQSTLRHFKDRQPFLSFRDRKGDPALMGLDEVNEYEKRNGRDLDESNRWQFYKNYLLNVKRSNEDEAYRQYFKKLLWNNLKTK